MLATKNNTVRKSIILFYCTISDFINILFDTFLHAYLLHYGWKFTNGQYTVSSRCSLRYGSYSCRVLSSLYSYIVFFRLTSFRINTSQKFILNLNILKLYVVVSVRFPDSNSKFLELYEWHTRTRVRWYFVSWFFDIFFKRICIQIEYMSYVEMYISRM